MTTISVPLSPELAQFVEETVKATGLSKSDVIRNALRLYAEEEAVRKVLLAAAEPSLSGDLDDLMSKI